MIYVLVFVGLSSMELSLYSECLGTNYVRVSYDIQLRVYIRSSRLESSLYIYVSYSSSTSLENTSPWLLRITNFEYQNTSAFLSLNEVHYGSSVLGAEMKL